MQDPFVVPAVARPTVAVAGTSRVFPVRRIFCVGRNYAEHSREMGATDLEAPPFFFTKPAEAVVPSGAVLPFPGRTQDLHHEIELVVAIGERREVFGYAAGIDLTRRDVQAQMKKQGKPWDTAKGFEHSAPISAIAPAADIGHPARGRIWLEVNGQLRQQGDIADMIRSVPELLAELATWFEVQAGDLVFTGTPAGVGALSPGDRVRGGVDGVGVLELTMGQR
jgi:fumarylpyruvate hydrolase